MPLQTVEPQRLYRQIADQLRTLIAKGEFATGARLPAERDLAKQFGVSRPSVREALIALEVEGRVEVRTGSGVYVLDRSKRSGTPVEVMGWGPLELIRARRVVEGETAALAATLAKRADRDAIARALDDMKELAARGVMPLDADRAFHLAIVRASGNAVLTETVQGFLDSRLGPLFKRLGGYFETGKSWQSAITEHEAVLAAIVARDPDAARMAMHEHMDKAHQRFSVSWRRAHAP
ncbi:FadR/GntR family transcriptional regulator [Variovorax sp. PBL-E5]|uniref:FadR/GntR family transcriptional regulator n=1 Tax=Variovorax sp. PBL-E5 TaxID=434014 RepID=UPI001316DDEC|nr:FadR/GntR family transcriptional regulator [Variovorax sp. PBL-E5]VTU19311.1 Putative L-lactate dehydrogenase operon regulatory protein [Variovorax sp. PBL-E5]